MERVKGIFSSLGDIRDGILVGASALYLLGYFGWAVFAWGFQLGVAPAFQAQYFVAGLPLLVVVALATAAAVLLRRLLIQRWLGWFGKRNRSTKLVLVISVALVTLLAALLQYAFPDYNFTLTRRPLWFTFAVAMVFLLGLLLLATPLGTEGVEGVGYTLLLYASVAILAVVPYIYLILSLYPRVPQFFGGGKPRCAYLDLYTERFSPEILSELVADPAINQVTVSATGIRDSTGTSTTRTLMLSVSGWPSNGYDSVLKAVANVAQASGPTRRGTYFLGTRISNKRIGASSSSNHSWASSDNGSGTNPCLYTSSYVSASGTSSTTINIDMR